MIYGFFMVSINKAEYNIIGIAFQTDFYFKNSFPKTILRIFRALLSLIFVARL